MEGLYNLKALVICETSQSRFAQYLSKLLTSEGIKLSDLSFIKADRTICDKAGETSQKFIFLWCLF